MHIHTIVRPVAVAQMVPRAYVLAIGLALTLSIGASEATVNLVVNTWAFTAATDAAWRVMMKDGARAVDVVEAGCATCEEEQCGGTVGWGGSPDENGETTLDAMIMDGTTMNAGSVAALRQVGNAVAVARAIMEGTEHTTLCGSQATDFASTALGMTPRDISSARSRAAHDEWKANNCQPNFWAKSGQIRPDSTLHCGPYKFGRSNGQATREPVTTSHDTISMVAIADGNVASATSTNGATFKIAGRVGDGPIIGSVWAWGRGPIVLILRERFAGQLCRYSCWRVWKHRRWRHHDEVPTVLSSG